LYSVLSSYTLILF
jgi:pyruvate dehydrogenase E2 component (dihydrolipoamide acetyltransferase)